MRAVIAILLSFLATPVSAQDVGDERAETVQASIEIVRPTGDEPVPRPFVVEGRAPAGAVLELRLDDEFQGIYRADANGAFMIPVDAVASRVEVRERGMESGAVVVVRVEGERVREAPRRQEDARATDRAEATVDDAVVGADVAATEQAADRIAASSDATVDPFRAADSIDPFQEADKSAPDATVEETDEGPRWNRWNAGVMIAQTLIGTLVGGGIGVSSFFILGGEAFLAQAAIGSALFGISALVLTVQALGAGWGGRAEWWATLVGALAGIAAGALFPPALLILPGLGATVGYHAVSEPQESE